MVNRLLPPIAPATGCRRISSRLLGKLSSQRPAATRWSDSAMNIQQHWRIVEFGAHEGLPAIVGVPLFFESGGLKSYSVSLAERSRTAASCIDRILRGAKPGELSIEQASELGLWSSTRRPRARSA